MKGFVKACSPEVWLQFANCDVQYIFALCMLFFVIIHHNNHHYNLVVDIVVVY